MATRGLREAARSAGQGKAEGGASRADRQRRVPPAALPAVAARARSEVALRRGARAEVGLPTAARAQRAPQREERGAARAEARQAAALEERAAPAAARRAAKPAPVERAAEEPRVAVPRRVVAPGPPAPASPIGRPRPTRV